MQHYEWPVKFRKIYDRGVQSYRAGNRKASTMFNEEEKSFLASIGCTPQELFDFVEDFVNGGEPDFETVLLMTAVRRDYFLFVQKGKPSSRVIDMNKLPAKSAEVAGIAWLPRLIEKARAKLRGEMPPELMYGCGGDRPFLQGVNVEPADFLRMVWAAGDDNQKVIDHVLKSRKER